MNFGGIDFPLPQTEYKENTYAQTCIQSLRETLDDNQRRLLLQVIDSKDLICEQYGEDMFAHGFRTCARLMLSCFGCFPGKADL